MALHITGPDSIEARNLVLKGEKRLLFVVIATSQGIANAPPILELGAEGDGLLWLETEQAKGRAKSDGWAKGADDVLERHGIRLRDRIGI
jgi:hypothetical protein